MSKDKTCTGICFNNWLTCLIKKIKNAVLRQKLEQQEYGELEEQLDDYNTIIERFLIACGKSKDLTEPEEFEEVFEEIEQTYSENEELKNLFQDPEVRVALTDVRTGDREVWRKLGNKAQKYKQALDQIENIVDDYNRACKTSQYYRDGFDQIQDIISKVKE